jgi:hypothetical protein
MTVDVAGGVFTDAAGNDNTVAPQNVQAVDTAPPTIAITDNAVGTATGDVTYTFNLSKASTNFAAGDITVAGGTAGTFTAVSSTQYTLVVTPPVNVTANMTVDVAGGVFTDAAGNNNIAATQSVQAFDTAPPTIAITDNAVGTATGDVTYTFNLSKASTNFAVGDITVAGGTAGTFTAVSSTQYTLVVTPPVNVTGNITVDVAGGAFTDAAGNNNTAATQSVQAFDIDITVNGEDDSVAATGFTANLLAGSWDGGTSQLYIGLVDTDGDGTPNTATTVGTLTDGGGTVEGAIAGDIDGDGDADFVFGNGNTTIAINLGDTDNNGVPEYQNISLNSSTYTRIHTLADLDNDGDLDVIAIGDGEGYYLNLADTNNDGLPEFGAYTALPGNNQSSWSGQAGDFDGDGNVDIVVGQWGGSTTQIFYGQGDIDSDGDLDFSVQTFSNSRMMGVGVADFDGDGDDDFITSSWNDTSTLLYTNNGDSNNDGQVEFAVSSIPWTGEQGNISNQQIADFDGDGDLDFAAAFGYGDQLVFYNQGDTDGDGDVDFVVDEIVINLMGSRFGSSHGDFDDDGDIDLVFSDTIGHLHIAENLGNTDGDPFVEWQVDSLDGVEGTYYPILLTDVDLFGSV